MPALALSRHGPVAAAAAGLTVTTAVVLIPPLRFAYRNPDLHLVLVTSEALIAMFAALLAVGRFRRRQQLDALLLAAALGVLSMVNLMFAAAPAAFGEDTSDFSTWSALAGRVLGAAMLAAAALAPRRDLAHPSTAAITATVCLALLGAIAVAVALIGDALPQAVDPSATPDRSGAPRLEGHGAVLAGHMIGFALLVVASVGFARRARFWRDPLVTALAIACPLSATARVNYLLFPSAATPYVYTGDGFRLLFYLVVLGGAIAELATYWRNAAEAAGLEARRAVARDLHDGIAQELAVIQRNLHYLDADDRFVRRAREAADRGAVVARQALSALSKADEGPLADAVCATARLIADREGVEVDLSVSEHADATVEQREATLAVLSEALTNAARHGGARRVGVRLTAGRSVTLSVRDHGSGFDPEAVHGPRPDGTGNGLPGMKARAELVGARLTITSAPGSGTTVELRLR